MSLADVAWRPPLIETERLVLRGREPSDVAETFRYASDPEVTPYMAWDRHVTLEDSWHYLNELVAENYRARELDYALALRSDPDTLIGGVGVFTSRPDHGVMELGYVLAREHWGHGYMPEALRALVRFTFATTGTQRIFAPIFAENDKSRRCAVKSGLHFEGVLRSSIEYRGVRRDEAIYAITRADS